MPANLRHFPEYNLDLAIFSGAVAEHEMHELFSRLERKANWLGFFAKNADLSAVDVACFPALRRALAAGDSEPLDAKPKRAALVNLSEPSKLFVDFWIRYAAAGFRWRKCQMFSTIELGCQWLELPAAAAETLAATTAAAKAGAEVGAAEAAETRRRLLKASSRIFRARGFDAATPAEIVAAADLPGGALDGLAESKDDLIVHAILDAMGDVDPIHGDIADFAADYLSPAQMANIEDGCAMAALAGEAIRQSPEARAAMTAGLTWNIDRLSRIAPGEDDAARHRAAVRAWAALVGALILARMSNDEALSQEFLGETQSWIADPAIAASAVAASRTAWPFSPDRPAS